MGKKKKTGKIVDLAGARKIFKEHGIFLYHDGTFGWYKSDAPSNMIPIHDKYLRDNCEHLDCSGTCFWLESDVQKLAKQTKPTSATIDNHDTCEYPAAPAGWLLVGDYLRGVWPDVTRAINNGVRDLVILMNNENLARICFHRIGRYKKAVYVNPVIMDEGIAALIKVLARPSAELALSHVKANEKKVATSCYSLLDTVQNMTEEDRKALVGALLYEKRGNNYATNNP